jgi:hypothetical protein
LISQKRIHIAGKFILIARTSFLCRSGLLLTFDRARLSCHARSGRARRKMHKTGIARIVSSKKRVKSNPPRQELAQGPKDWSIVTGHGGDRGAMLQLWRRTGWRGEKSSLGSWGCQPQIKAWGGATRAGAGVIRSGTIPYDGLGLLRGLSRCLDISMAIRCAGGL